MISGNLKGSEVLTHLGAQRVFDAQEARLRRVQLFDTQHRSSPTKFTLENLLNWQLKTLIFELER